MKKLITLIAFIFLFSTLSGQGNCLNFTASEDRVTLTSEIFGSSDFTLEIWFKSDNTTINGTMPRVFTWWGAPNSRLEGGDIDGDFILFTKTVSGTTEFIDTNVFIRDGEWHHFAITRQGNDYIIYIDGNLTNAFNKSIDLYNYFRIGNWNGTLILNSQWIGDLDELRLWNQARSQSDIQSTMNCELIGNEACLVGYWNFNQGTPAGDNTGLTTLTDLTSNGNDGTLYDFSLMGSTSNWITSGADISGVCSNVTCSILPVELIDFKGSAHKNNIQLEWITASEVNNLGFEIQKSTDLKNWDVLGFVEGKKNSNKLNNYAFTDQKPIPGVNYYRLRQIDLDEAFEFSDIVPVKFNDKIENINVFPNPSNGSVNLELNRPLNESVLIKIYNSNGMQVYHNTLHGQEILTIEEQIFERDGIYLISINHGSKVYHKKLVISGRR
ncbi:MAG: LamG-like jellyroll fold domain-containing protein [Bacteroidota bacterium]